MPIVVETNLRRPIALTVALLAAASLAGCSKSSEAPAPDTSASTTTATPTAAAPAAEAPAATPAPAPAAAAAKPAPDNTDTVSGAKLADFTGDAAAGEKVFIQCKTCHVTDAGVNRIGPSLHGIVGRHAGIAPGFTYSAANKDSGITWSEAKLFQYLENPQRVVPGTKMTFTGVKDPQKRADVIAYLKTQS